MYLNNYECKTTFWQDFTIAELFGEDAIKDTCRRASNEWKSDKVFITELVMVLNHRSWYHHDHRNYRLADLYAGLYYDVYEVALRNLKGDDLAYFYQVTD